MQTPLLGISNRLAHPFRRKPHTPRSSTSPVKFRIQGFSPSLRFTPPSASQVYFTPLTPFGFSLQGFPLPRSRTDSSPVLYRLAACPWLRSHRLEGGSNGALGFILEIRPVPLLGFTVLLPLKVRCSGLRYSLGPVLVPLLGFSSLRSSRPLAMPRLSPVLLSCA
jgi:hypothetical protein